jgi:2'-5' RNA ligase
MKDHPEVQTLAGLAQQRLAGFRGLHFTPRQWLHLTVLLIGLADDIPPATIDVMIREARLSLGRVPPTSVTFGRVLYHREAITLGVQPDGALDPVLAAVREAQTAAGVSSGVRAGPWIPHVTVAYSTTEQPAAPIISALGRELPECNVTVSTVSLVAQQGPERRWNWRCMAEVPLAG